MSFTIAVKLITESFCTAIVKFCEHWSLVPVTLTLKYSLNPLWFITNWQNDNPVSSETLAVKLTLCRGSTLSSSSEAFMLGSVESVVSRLMFSSLLLLTSMLAEFGL